MKTIIEYKRQNSMGGEWLPRWRRGCTPAMGVDCLARRIDDLTAAGAAHRPRHDLARHLPVLQGHIRARSQECACHGGTKGHVGEPFCLLAEKEGRRNWAYRAGRRLG